MGQLGVVEVEQVGLVAVDQVLGTEKPVFRELRVGQQYGLRVANAKRCTWVYRVAHNVAASHVDKQMRARKRMFVSLEELEGRADERVGVAAPAWCMCW